jgi:hypothetical protein
MTPMKSRRQNQYHESPQNFLTQRQPASKRDWNRVALITATFFTAIAFSIPGQAGTWTALTNAAPSGAGTMQLLSDGSIMVQRAGVTNSFMRLRPDIHGSYIAGTWTSDIANMSRPRLYYASNILPDGRRWVLGGEYSTNGGNGTWDNTGEIYNPVTNTWTPIANYPKAQFGDDPSMVVITSLGLRILAGDLSTNQPFLYNPATNTWSPAAAKVYNDRSDEETWVKLPNGRVLTYDIFRSIATATGNAEIYDPLANSWSSITPGVNGTTGTLPLMSSNALGAEFGPAFLLPDGRVLQLGATDHTALYDPATNNWAQGPSLPSGMGADDAPGAIAPNGHVIFTADTPLFHSPTKVFEYDPVAGTYIDITPAGTALGSVPAFVTRMLVLPTGQVLLSDSSNRPWVYTPDAPVTATARPIVNGVTYNGGGVFTLTGSQINGQSSGSSYGDDVNHENYPIIRITSPTGNL